VKHARQIDIGYGSIDRANATGVALRASGGWRGFAHRINEQARRSNLSDRSERHRAASEPTVH
jgi:hypothetical protein